MIANAAIARKFNKKERTGGTIKMKKPAIKQTKPGNWKESEIIGTICMTLSVQLKLMVC